MSEVATGEFVLYEDYAALERELAEARELIEAAHQEHERLAHAADEYIGVMDPDYVGDMPTWFVARAAEREKVKEK